MPQKVPEFSPESLFVSFFKVIPIFLFGWFFWSEGKRLTAVCPAEEDKGLIVRPTYFSTESLCFL